MRRLLLVFCLSLLLVVSFVNAGALEAIPEASPSIGEVEAIPGAPSSVEDVEPVPGIDLPSAGAEYGPEVVELLVSINTYLTYLFAFALLFALLTAGKLIYSLFNMFF